MALAISLGVNDDDVLLSPVVGYALRPRPEDYAAITPESLKTKTFPHLTSYERVSPPPGGWKTRSGPKPLIADFSLPDVVFVFLSNGNVEEVTREEFARY